MRGHCIWLVRRGRGAMAPREAGAIAPPRRFISTNFLAYADPVDADVALAGAIAVTTTSALPASTRISHHDLAICHIELGSTAGCEHRWHGISAANHHSD